MGAGRYALTRHMVINDTCAEPRMAQMCVIRRLISVGTGSGVRPFIGMNLAMSQPMAPMLPSSERMCGRPNRRKMPALKSST